MAVPTIPEPTMHTAGSRIDLTGGERRAGGPAGSAGVPAARPATRRSRGAPRRRSGRRARGPPGGCSARTVPTGVPPGGAGPTSTVPCLQSGEDVPLDPWGTGGERTARKTPGVPVHRPVELRVDRPVPPEVRRPPLEVSGVVRCLDGLSDDGPAGCDQRGEDRRVKGAGRCIREPPCLFWDGELPEDAPDLPCGRPQGREGCG